MLVPTDESQRAALIMLCVAMGRRVSSLTTGALAREAERLVPPVPAPEPEYIPYKGVTYRDGRFWSKGGCGYDMASQVIANWPDDLTDDDHAALMQLKANPVKVSDAPDKDCVTLPDGSCVSDKHCMHGPGAPVLYLNRWAGSDWAAYTTHDAATKAMEPEQVEISVPLYRLPATEAAALALLEAAGAVEYKETDVYAVGLGCVGRGVHALILPHRRSRA